MNAGELRSAIKRLLVTELNLKGRDPETIEDDGPLVRRGPGARLARRAAARDVDRGAARRADPRGRRGPGGLQERARHRRLRRQGAWRVSARLWVTGLGLVTPLGAGVEETWARLVRGERAIRPVTLFETQGPARERGRRSGDGRSAGRPAGRRGRVVADERDGARRRRRGDADGAPATRRRRASGWWSAARRAGCSRPSDSSRRCTREPECRRTLVSMLSHPLTATGDRLDERLGPVRPRTDAVERVLERRQRDRRRGGVAARRERSTPSWREGATGSVA